MWNIRKLIKKGIYDYALIPEHPKATKNGYVLYHRAAMENHLNRLLNDDEVVHHIDKNTHNNDISNLQVLTIEQHNLIHKIKQNTYAEIICPGCGNNFIALKRNSVDKKQYCCSRHCGRLFQLLSRDEQEKRKQTCLIRIFKA